MSSARMESQQPSNADEPVDYFSSLPPELIRRIFELAYAEEFPPGPLSKALLPFFHEHLYTGFRFENYRDLEAFMRHIAAYRDRGKLVSSLRLGPDELGDEFPPYDGARDDFTTSPPPSNNQLSKFFAALTRLKFLSIEGADAAITFVLAHGSAKKRFRNLTDLVVAGSFPGVERPFFPGNFSTLALYPALTRLDIDVDRCVLQPTSPTRQLTSEAPMKHFGRLTSLCIAGDTFDIPSIEAILRSSTSLTDVALTERAGKADLVKLVENVPNPALLKDLSLSTSCGDDDEDDQPAVGDLVPFLRQTPLLEYLYVDGAAEVSPVFFDALYSLRHLETLDIGEDTSLSPEHLLGYLSRPHSSLRLLSLSNIFSERGEPLEYVGLDDVPFSEDGKPLLLGWSRPFWRDGWTVEAVKKVREAAEKLGLVVEGSTFDAETYEEDAAEETARLCRFVESKGVPAPIIGVRPGFDAARYGLEQDEDGEGGGRG
ncbi:hypothetical protein JCM8097_001073 [Rhodosporidiobolus ruineniae]